MISCLHFYSHSNWYKDEEKSNLTTYTFVEPLTVFNNTLVQERGTGLDDCDFREKNQLAVGGFRACVGGCSDATFACGDGVSDR